MFCVSYQSTNDRSYRLLCFQLTKVGFLSHLNFVIGNDYILSTILNETCTLIICLFIFYLFSPTYWVFQPCQVDGTQNFKPGAVTMSNRKFSKMSLNLVAICLATNNREHPSIKMTQTYDTTQRVQVGDKILDLQEAVQHNVQIMVTYLKKN